MDISIVNVALPAIGRDLHAPVAGLHRTWTRTPWCRPASCVLAGATADQIGRHHVFQVRPGRVRARLAAVQLAPGTATCADARRSAARRAACARGWCSASASRHLALALLHHRSLGVGHRTRAAASVWHRHLRAPAQPPTSATEPAPGPRAGSEPIPASAGRDDAGRFGSTGGRDQVRSPSGPSIALRRTVPVRVGADRADSLPSPGASLSRGPSPSPTSSVRSSPSARSSMTTSSRSSSRTAARRYSSRSFPRAPRQPGPRRRLARSAPRRAARPRRRPEAARPTRATAAARSAQRPAR